MSTAPDDAWLDVVLRPERDRAVRRRHPWLLAGAVARVDPAAGPGAAVCVRAADGEALGWGLYAPQATLRVRLLAFGKEAPRPGWLGERVRMAVARRRDDPRLARCEAVRLVNAEGDFLPGLVADRYADVVVVRTTHVGMAVRREEVAHALRQASGAAHGFERADAAAARREGFEAASAVLWGAPPPRLVVREGEGRRYHVDVVGGQKTGFYLDQRDARDLVQRLAAGRRVLDLFCYTGGFAVAAALGGAAHVTAVDASAPALALARENLAGVGDCGFELLEGDAFAFLRQPGPAFDLLVIDPPPLARARRDVERAARAYKDLLLHGLRRAAPGAWLLAFACSHHVGPELFRRIAFGAARDAGRAAQVIGTLEAPPDHPVSIDHPEGRYLTGLLLRT